MMEVSAEVAMDPVHLIVDRPFMFAIVERKSKVILFMGRVMNPNE
ncbi:MAG: serpin family protein [Chloroflexia bacterium]